MLSQVRFEVPMRGVHNVDKIDGGLHIFLDYRLFEFLQNLWIEVDPIFQPEAVKNKLWCRGCRVRLGKSWVGSQRERMRLEGLPGGVASPVLWRGRRAPPCALASGFQIHGVSALTSIASK